MVSNPSSSILTHQELQTRALKSVQTLMHAVDHHVATTNTTANTTFSTKKLTRQPSLGPNSKLGKSLHHEILEYIQHVYAHFSQEKGLELLEFLHRLQFDVLEPQLSTLYHSSSALHSFIHVLATCMKTLFVDAPEGTVYTASSWVGVWGHCLKSFLLITNSMIESPSIDPLYAFQCLSDLLIHFLESKDLFYRIQCEAMTIFVQLLSRHSENKKVTRQTYLTSLLNALEHVPSVELQCMLIECIYRVLPALRHLRKQTLSPYHLKDTWMDLFTAMDASNFETTSRTLVNLINQTKTASSANNSDYPATAQLTRIVYQDESVHLETPLLDTTVYFFDLTPDAMVFTCTFINQSKETIFDLPFENITKYFLLPHLRQVEFTAVRVPKWSSPKEMGQAHFLFQVANEASMFLLSQSFHYHCPNVNDFMTSRPHFKLSKLEIPVKTMALETPHQGNSPTKDPSRVVHYFSGNTSSSLSPKKKRGPDAPIPRTLVSTQKPLHRWNQTPDPPVTKLSTPPHTDHKPVFHKHPEFQNNRNEPENEHENEVEEEVPNQHESRNESEPGPLDGKENGVPEPTINQAQAPLEPPMTPPPTTHVISKHPPIFSIPSPTTFLDSNAPLKKKHKPMVSVPPLPGFKKREEVPPLTSSSSSLVPNFSSMHPPSPFVPSYPPTTTPLSTTADHVQLHMKKLQDRLQQLENQTPTQPFVPLSHPPSRMYPSTKVTSTSTSKYPPPPPPPPPPSTTPLPHPPLSPSSSSSSSTLFPCVSGNHDFESWGQWFGQYLSYRFHHQDDTLQEMRTRHQAFEQHWQHQLQTRLDQAMVFMEQKTQCMEDTVHRELQLARQVMQGAEQVLEKTISVIGRSHQDSVRALEELHGQMTSAYHSSSNRRPPFSS